MAPRRPHTSWQVMFSKDVQRRESVSPAIHPRQACHSLVRSGTGNPHKCARQQAASACLLGRPQSVGAQSDRTDATALKGLCCTERPRQALPVAARMLSPPAAGARRVRAGPSGDQPPASEGRPAPASPLRAGPPEADTASPAGPWVPDHWAPKHKGVCGSMSPGRPGTRRQPRPRRSGHRLSWHDPDHGSAPATSRGQ